MLCVLKFLLSFSNNRAQGRPPSSTAFCEMGSTGPVVCIPDRKEQNSEFSSFLGAMTNQTIGGRFILWKSAQVPVPGEVSLVLTCSHFWALRLPLRQRNFFFFNPMEAGRLCVAWKIHFSPPSWLSSGSKFPDGTCTTASKTAWLAKRTMARGKRNLSPEFQGQTSIQRPT